MLRDPKLDRFNKEKLTDPPRSVPLSVRIRILSGGFCNQFGWLFFGFGLVFVWVFGGTNALHNAAFFSGELKTAQGKVTAVVETNVSINEREIYKYHYLYEVDESTYSGTTKGFGGKYKEKQQANIEYCTDDHSRSRIKGLSTGSGLAAFFPAIFPAVGLFFMFFGIHKGLKGGRLLRDGKLTIGALISKERTNTRVNDQTVYKFTFAFQGDDQETYNVTAKTHMTERFAGEEVEGIENDEHVLEPLLFNPLNPSDAVLFDDLPGGPRISENGAIKGMPLSIIPTLLIPCITICGHGYWFLHVLEMI